MGLQELIDRLNSKKSFVEGSQINIPVGGSNLGLAEVMDRFLDVRNSRQLSHIGVQERAYGSILDAYSYARDEYDIDGFLRSFVENMFILSSSVEGHRSQELQNIAVGQLNREFAMELADIRSGSKKENKELDNGI